MQLINPKVEIIPQEEGLLGVYKQIEKAGRTCYKSEDRITEDSAETFVQKMIILGHTAMLEHGTIYLKVPNVEWWRDLHEWEYMFPEGCPWIKINTDSLNHYISTNYRYIIMMDMGSDLFDKYMCGSTDDFEKRVSVRFTCDRGVSHELVRHKKLCVA